MFAGSNYLLRRPCFQGLQTYLGQQWSCTLRYNHRVESVRPAEEFTRGQVRRMLKIHERTLASWEDHELVAVRGKFGFADLTILRTLKRLRESRVPPQRIKNSLIALQERIGVREPLTELRLWPQGRTITVDLPSGKMDALSGQLLLDFTGDSVGDDRVRTLERPTPDDAEVRAAEAEIWFQRGLEIEETEQPAAEAAAAYKKAVELNPDAAGAWVNLGTLHYRSGDLTEAEEHYRRAITITPDYALAHFNLGNVCEERGRLEEASQSYERALELHSTYADAHYNVALVYERLKEPMRAAKHWRSYLKLDPASPWAGIARQQLDGLVEVRTGGGGSPKS